MSYKPGWEPGRWSTICDVCGFRFHSDDIKDRWDGLKVCRKDWEPRHPQDFLRAKKEKISPEWVRPEATDSFTFVCTLWGTSAYAGLAVAGCSQAAETTYPYQFLYDLSIGH